MSSLVFPSMVRDQILERHAELRELINHTLAATGNLERDGPGPVQLEKSARELHERFREHLAFEERALVPVLWVVDGWGPERVRDLRQEHARQRLELDTVIEGLESGWSVERLALALRRLATDLLTDMDEEEDGCLRATLLGDRMLDYERR